MKNGVSLRVRALLVIMPLVVAVVVTGGVLASVASRTALTRVATRLMAYKAEQLRDFSFSQWEVISDLGLAGDTVYRRAAEAAVQSYATSLIRRDTEWIFAVDKNGRIVMSTTGVAADVADEVGDDVASIIETSSFPGWFDGSINEIDRVGEIFRFPPFGWTFFVTEHHESFYRDVAQITYSHSVILLVSLVVAAILVSLFVSVIVRPIERLSSTMLWVHESGDLSCRAQIEYADEVGLLATNFNTMTTSLEKSYEVLRETARAEEEARRLATKREEETLLVLGRATEFRDADTGEHIDRVGILCGLLMRLLGGTEEEVTLIRKSAPLHDVGKIGISDTILLKPGKLTPEEFDTMKQHTLIGWNILKDSESIFLRDGARIALSHHERWDGTGYPTGTSGEEIPLIGRITAVVDVFDALTSVRPYKSAWDPRDAREFILDQRGAHFDPRIVDIFDAHFSLIRETANL